MNPISVVFSKRNSFNLFSLGIQFGLKTPYSHVAIKMIDGDTGQVVYYQASGLSVNCVSEAEFLNAETIVYERDFQVSDKVFKTGKAFAINQLGKPYSIAAIIGFSLQIMLGWFGIKISNPFKNNGSQYVCSQFAGAFIDASENIQMDITDMTPLALYNIIPSIPEQWN